MAGFFGIKFLREAEFIHLKEEMSIYKRTLEDMGWINMTTNNFSEKDLIQGGFRNMIQRAKVIYYNNPLAKHWIQLTTSFVFGEGISTPKSDDESVQEVIEEFWDDRDNQKALTGYLAQQALCNKLQYEGNIFFCIFDDEEGRCRVRVLNTLEVSDIIMDADDRQRPLFYKVAVSHNSYNFGSDAYEPQGIKYEYFPDIENDDPESYGVPKDKLRLDAKIYHVKINSDLNDKYGVPDLYCAMDWIKAHKDMAGDIATLVKALSKFAWNKKIKGTPAQVSSIAGAMTSRTNLTNISTMSGQTNVENEASSLQPVDIKTGGVQIGKEGSREMKLMVCAASGLFEHYFGDPSTGNLATAKSMELPMVKKFVNYQQLWRGVYIRIIMYVIERKMILGLLDGSVLLNPKTKRNEVTSDLDTTLDLDFPSILEEDLQIMANALKVAKESGFVSDELASRLFLLAANVENVDEEIENATADREKRKAEQDAQFQQKLGQFDPNNPNPKNGLPPIKEAIAVPGKAGTRLAKKNNYLTQKMNGYRKALSSHYRLMEKAIKASAQTSRSKDKVVGHIPKLEEAVRKMGEGMKQSAKSYFPMAIQIGEKYTQVHLKEMGLKVNETLYEATNKSKSLLQKRLDWNAEYVTESLVPDIIEGIAGTMKMAYDSEDEFNSAISNKIKSYEARIEQYVGALWTVEEDAVREAGKGTGMQVNFAGEEDEENCQGCADAIAGSPYDIDEAPLPGEQDCLGRCRHALQIVE